MLGVSTDGNGGMIIETRGKNTAWKHTIKTEEIKPY